MRIINCRSVFVFLSTLLSFDVFANSEPAKGWQQQSIVMTNSRHKAYNSHLHGGEVYQFTQFQQSWQKQDHQAQWSSDLDYRIGTDEHKMVLKAHVKKHTSVSNQYDVAFMYSRNISDFWDMRVGLEYAKQHEQQNRGILFGFHGLAAYFFETDAYLYIGQNQQLQVNLQASRDVLLTQKLIMQPYIDLGWVIQDHAEFPQQKGLSALSLGLQTRYEITKKIMPYFDVSYQYEKLPQQQGDFAHSSDGLALGTGLLFKF